MQTRRGVLTACLVLLPALGLAAWLLPSTRHTWFELSDAGTGRRIVGQLLPDGEHVVFTWTNSLFRLPVTEVFVAGSGVLTLIEITFAHPDGRDPPLVRPQDVDDLYHTGGPFRAKGLSRPVDRVVFRVGEIGRPTIRFANHLIEMTREVGFGGAVLLVARRPTLYEHVVGWLLRGPRRVGEAIGSARGPNSVRKQVILDDLS